MIVIAFPVDIKRYEIGDWIIFASLYVFFTVKYGSVCGLLCWSECPVHVSPSNFQGRMVVDIELVDLPND